MDGDIRNPESILRVVQRLRQISDDRFSQNMAKALELALAVHGVTIERPAAPDDTACGEPQQATTEVAGQTPP